MQIGLWGVQKNILGAKNATAVAYHPFAYSISEVRSCNEMFASRLNLKFQWAKLLSWIITFKGKEISLKIVSQTWGKYLLSL